MLYKYANDIIVVTCIYFFVFTQISSFYLPFSSYNISLKNSGGSLLFPSTRSPDASLSLFFTLFSLYIALSFSLFSLLHIYLRSIFLEISSLSLADNIINKAWVKWEWSWKYEGAFCNVFCLVIKQCDYILSHALHITPYQNCVKSWYNVLLL